MTNYEKALLAWSRGNCLPRPAVAYSYAAGYTPFLMMML